MTPFASTLTMMLLSSADLNLNALPVCELLSVPLSVTSPPIPDKLAYAS